MNKTLLWAGIIFILALAGYAAYHAGYGAGNRKYAGHIAQDNPRKWVDDKWKFSLEFPSTWEILKKAEMNAADTGAEVSCANKSGSLAKLFVHPVVKGETADSIENEVFNRYKNIYRNLAVIERKAYLRNNAQYKIFVLKGTDTEHPDEVHYEALVFVKKVCLLIAFTSPTEKYESSKKDFEKIIDTVIFF